MVMRQILIIVLIALVTGCMNKGATILSHQSAYSVTVLGYQHKYGDSVRVIRADNEFVICENCKKISKLERQPSPVPVVIKFSTIPQSTSNHIAQITTATADLSRPTEVNKADGDPAHDETCRSAVVYFSLNSAVVNQTEMQKIIGLLDSFRGRKVEVLGYTCDLGNNAHNDRLAFERASAVANILEKSGINPVSVSGKGKCCYLSQNKSLNRRAEVQCSGKDSR